MKAGAVFSATKTSTSVPTTNPAATAVLASTPVKAVIPAAAPMVSMVLIAKYPWTIAPGILV